MSIKPARMAGRGHHKNRAPVHGVQIRMQRREQIGDRVTLLHETTQEETNRG